MKSTRCRIELNERCFPKIKRTLKGHYFSSIDEIKSTLLRELNFIPKIEFSMSDFRDWREC